jgi:hypothetical protein
MKDLVVVEVDIDEAFWETVLQNAGALGITPDEFVSQSLKYYINKKHKEEKIG